MSGEPWSTLDVDMVVALTASDVGALTDALRGEFDLFVMGGSRGFRKGNEVSDRLGLSDLLARAESATGPHGSPG